MQDAIEADASALRAYSEGKASVPLRPTIPTPDGPTLLMPAGVEDDSGYSCGVKVVSVRTGNHARGLPTIPAFHCDLDAVTGAVRTLLDGGALTYLRTGALSGVAARYLARKDSKVLVVIGGGMQGRAGTEAILCECKEISDIYVCGVSAKANQAYVDWAQAKYPAVKVHQGACSPEENDRFVAMADVVLTTTTSPTPVFSGASLKPGTFVSCVGAYQPHTREVDTETIKRARVYVDTKDGALNEAGDLLIPIKEKAITAEHVLGELGEVILGKVPSRQSPEEVCLFKTVGSAVLDVAVGHAIALLGEKREAGSVVEF